MYLLPGIICVYGNNCFYGKFAVELHERKCDYVAAKELTHSSNIQASWNHETENLEYRKNSCGRKHFVQMEEQKIREKASHKGCF